MLAKIKFILKKSSTASEHSHAWSPLLNLPEHIPQMHSNTFKTTQKRSRNGLRLSRLTGVCVSYTVLCECHN